MKWFAKRVRPRDTFDVTKVGFMVTWRSYDMYVIGWWV